MYSLDTCDENLNTPKRLESVHRACDSFDAPMVLFDDVVDVFVLAQQDILEGASRGAFNGRSIGTALIDSDLFRHAVQVVGTFQKAPRGGYISFGSQ